MKTQMLILLAGAVGLAMAAPQFNLNNDQPMPYSFAYGVNAGGTGDLKEHKESVSPSGVLEGEYRWLQPNGLYRVTRYTADNLSGYRAVVTQEPGEDVPNYYRNSQNEKGLTAGSSSSQQSFSNFQSGNQAFSRPQNFGNFQSNQGTSFSSSLGFQNEDFNRGQSFNQGQNVQSQSFTSPQNFQGQIFSTALTVPGQNFAFDSQLQGNVIDGGIIDGGIIDGGIIDGGIIDDGIIDGGFSNDFNGFGSNFNQFTSNANRFTTGSSSNSFSSGANNFGSTFNRFNNAGFQSTGRNQGIAVVLARNTNRFSG